MAAGVHPFDRGRETWTGVPTDTPGGAAGVLVAWLDDSVIESVGPVADCRCPPGRYWKPLAGGLLAVLGETAADVLEPWPIKVIVDAIVQSKPLPHWLRAPSPDCSHRIATPC